MAPAGRVSAVPSDGSLPRVLFTVKRRFVDGPWVLSVGAFTAIMRVIEVVIDVRRLLHGFFRGRLTCRLQGFKSYAVRTVISGWFVKALMIRQLCFLTFRTGTTASIQLRA